MTDWRGTPIAVGATIIYPSRQSSSVWMNEGIVEKIHMHDVSPDRHEPSIKKLTVRRTRLNRGWREIQRPVTTIFNVKEVTVVGAPNVKTADLNSARNGMKL